MKDNNSFGNDKWKFSFLWSKIIVMQIFLYYKCSFILFLDSIVEVIIKSNRDTRW